MRAVALAAIFLRLSLQLGYLHTGVLAGKEGTAKFVRAALA